MPTYSYRCADCGHEYDAFQSMKAEKHTECPECQGLVERLIGGGAGILFKGSGFYVTDYKKTSNGTPKSSESSGSGGESSGSGAASSSSSGGQSSPSASSSSSSSSSASSSAGSSGSDA